MGVIRGSIGIKKIDERVLQKEHHSLCHATKEASFESYKLGLRFLLRRDDKKKHWDKKDK